MQNEIKQNRNYVCHMFQKILRFLLLFIKLIARVSFNLNLVMALKHRIKLQQHEN